MPLTTHAEVHAAIKQELARINDDGTHIPEDELDSMADIILQTPEEQREEYVINFVRDTLERRRGDPRS